MTLNADISALVEKLSPHNTLDPPNGHWIKSSEGDMVYDPDHRGGGADWCEVCGDDVLMRLNLYTPGEQIYLGCWNDTAGNHDAIPSCTSCGKTLAGWPTKYCRSEELACFEEEPDFEPNPENIHVVFMVLWNLQWGEHKDLGAWRAVGEGLLAKIEGVVHLVADPTRKGVEG